MESHTLYITPFSILVDGVPVTVLEVLKTVTPTGQPYYHVVLRMNYKGVESRTFSIHVRSTEELVSKLKVEVTKVKMIEYAYGMEVLRRLIA